jgi:hypothetical protein
LRDDQMIFYIVTFFIRAMLKIQWGDERILIVFFERDVEGTIRFIFDGKGRDLLHLFLMVQVKVS